MTVSSVNSLLNTQLTSSINNIRDRISTVSQETVTGRFSDLVTQLDGRIDQALLSQKAVTDIDTERSQLDLRAARLDLSQIALTNINDAIGDLPIRIQGGVGSEDLPVIRFAALEAAGILDEVFGSLNLRHGERFLFSGDATATPPLGDAQAVIDDISAIAATATDTADFEAQLDTYFDDPAGTYQQTIYSGSLTSSDPDSISAAAPAIRDVIRNLAIIASSDPESGPALLRTPSDALSGAANGISTSLRSLTDLRAEQGLRQEEIGRQTDALAAEEAILTVAFNNLTARDQFEAAVELQDLQTNLEASFLLTSRLSSLTLSNFLR